MSDLREQTVQRQIADFIVTDPICGGGSSSSSAIQGAGSSRVDGNQSLETRMSHYTTCEECGWTSNPCRSEAQASFARRVHSCDRHRRKLESRERGSARRAAVDRAPKPCPHKRASHLHGTYACYTLDRCRCDLCAAAGAAYRGHRKRQQAYGRWDNFVDADPVRLHVLDLMSYGLGLRRIAALAGVSYSAAGNLVYGSASRQKSRRVRRDIATRLLAVPADFDLLAPGQLVDSTGAARRVQALVAIGWSLRNIAARLAMEPSRLSQLVHGRRRAVTVARYRAVCKLYDELWNRLPPVTASRDMASARRARRLAAAKGWLSPLAWDDATIDDPGATPNRGCDCHVVVDEIAIEQAMQGHRVPLTREERADAVQRLVQKGWSCQQIATTLRISKRTVERERHRRHGSAEESAA